jgi:hypothetical protein
MTKILLRKPNTDGTMGNWLRRARIECGFQLASLSGIVIDPRLPSAFGRRNRLRPTTSSARTNLLSPQSLLVLDS